MSNERDQTIQDFGRQWTNFSGNVGYRVSGELFDDLIEPLVSASAFKDCSVAALRRTSPRLRGTDRTLGHRSCPSSRPLGVVYAKVVGERVIQRSPLSAIT